MTLAEIARLIEGKVVGDENLVITGLSGIQEAQEGEMTFVTDPKYILPAQKTKASALIISRDMEIPGKSVILADNPSFAFTKVIAAVSDDEAHHFKGIHQTAIVAEDAILGENIAIGPYGVVESRAKIGNNTEIHSGTYVGREAVIGEGCLIYPNITIRERTKIGNRVIIHSGTVIGSDGFGFTRVKGLHEKIPQIGIVVIEDDVEIGANVTIDRARFNKTVVGAGTKIDNLVQIGHNVIIGKNCIIVSQVGISGSVVIEDGAVLAGQVGVAGHLTIGKGAVVAAQTAVMKSVPPGTKVIGSPARHYDEELKISALVRRLPKYVKEIKELKKKVEDLESKTKNN